MFRNLTLFSVPFQEFVTDVHKIRFIGKEMCIRCKSTSCNTVALRLLLITLTVLLFEVRFLLFKLMHQVLTYRSGIERRLALKCCMQPPPLPTRWYKHLPWHTHWFGSVRKWNWLALFPIFFIHTDSEIDLSWFGQWCRE